VCATITRASQRACCTVACSARLPPSAVSFPQHRRHHHRPQSADNPQASAMHLSNSRRSSPAVYSTTSIPACQIRRPGRPSLRGTEHRPISPPSRTSYTDVLPPRGAGRSFLVLATDGLSELYDGTPRAEMAADWARCVAEAAAEAPSAKGENLALRLLRHALGGDDLMSLSQMVTLDMDTPWMDDTTIIVQAL
jgi:hypothetical protein